MRELLTAICLEPIKGNFKIEAGQILLQVKKFCTDRLIRDRTELQKSIL